MQGSSAYLGGIAVIVRLLRRYPWRDAAADLNTASRRKPSQDPAKRLPAQ
jgi:hypothetical protein